MWNFQDLLLLLFTLIIRIECLAPNLYINLSELFKPRTNNFHLCEWQFTSEITTSSLKDETLILKHILFTKSQISNTTITIKDDIKNLIFLNKNLYDSCGDNEIHCSSVSFKDKKIILNDLQTVKSDWSLQNKYQYNLKEIDKFQWFYLCNSFFFNSSVFTAKTFSNSDSEKGMSYLYYKTYYSLSHASRKPLSSIQVFYSSNNFVKIKTPLLLMNLNVDMVHVILMKSMFGYPTILDKSLYQTLTRKLQLIKFEGDNFKVDVNTKSDFNSSIEKNIFCIDKQTSMSVKCYHNSYSNLTISYSNSYLFISNVTNMTDDFVDNYKILYDSGNNKDFVFNKLYQKEDSISSKICARIIFANPNSFVNSYFMDNDLFNDNSIKSSTVCDFAQFPLETRFLQYYNYFIILFYHTENKQIIFHLDIMENLWNSFSSKRVYYSDYDTTNPNSRRILSKSFNRLLLSEDQKYNDMINLVSSNFTQVNGKLYFPNVYKILSSNGPKPNKELLINFSNTNVSLTVGINYFFCFYVNMKSSMNLITPPFSFNFKYFNENNSKSFSINHIFFPFTQTKDGYLTIQRENALNSPDFKENYTDKNIVWVHYCFNFFKQNSIDTYFNENIYSSFYGSRIDKKGTIELKTSGGEFPQLTIQLNTLKKDFKLANLLFVNFKTIQDSNLYQKLRLINYNALSYFSIMFPTYQDFTIPLVKSWDLISNFDHYETSDSFYLDNIYLNSNLNEFMYVFQDGYPKINFHNSLFDIHVKFDGEFLLKNCFSSYTNFIADVKFIIGGKEIASFDINLKSQSIYSIYNLQSSDNIVSVIVRVDVFIQTFLFYTDSFAMQNTIPPSNINNGFISKFSLLQTMYIKAYETNIRRVPNKSISNYIMLFNEVSLETPTVDLVNNIYSENWILLEKVFPGNGLINTKYILSNQPTLDINKNIIKFSYGSSKNFSFMPGFMKSYLISRYLLTSNFLNSFNYFPLTTTINSNNNKIDFYYNFQTKLEKSFEVYLSRIIVSNSNTQIEGKLNLYIKYPSSFLLIGNNIVFNYPYPDLFTIKSIEYLDNTITVYKLEIRDDPKIKQYFGNYNYIKVDYSYNSQTRVLIINFLVEPMMIRAYIYNKSINNQPSIELILNIMNVQSPMYFSNTQSLSFQFTEFSPELNSSKFVSSQRIELTYNTNVIISTFNTLKIEFASSNLIYLKEIDNDIDFSKIIFPFFDSVCSNNSTLPFRHLKTNLRYFEKVENNILLSVFDQYFEFYISKNCINCNMEIRNNKTGTIIQNNPATSYFTYRTDPNFDSSSKIQNHDQLIFILNCPDNQVDITRNRITTQLETILTYPSSLSYNIQNTYNYSFSSKFIEFKNDYNITTKVLILNKIDQQSVCSWEYKLIDSSSDINSFSIINSDCFGLELMFTDKSITFSKLIVIFNIKDVIKNEIAVNNLSFKGKLESNFFSLSSSKTSGLLTDNFDIELKKLTEITFSPLKISCDYNINDLLSQNNEFTYDEIIFGKNNSFVFKNISLIKFNQSLFKNMNINTEYTWNIQCTLSLKDSNSILLQPLKINIKNIIKPDVPINATLTTNQITPKSNEILKLTLILPDISNNRGIKYNCNMILDSINIPNIINLEKIDLTPPETRIPIDLSLSEIKEINWNQFKNNTLYPIKFSCKFCITDNNCYQNDLLINITYINPNNKNDNSNNNNSDNNNSNNNNGDRKKLNETEINLENIILNETISNKNQKNCTGKCEDDMKKIQNETVKKLNDVLNCSFLKTITSNDTKILTLSAEAINKITKNHKFISSESSDILLNLTDCLFNQSVSKSFSNEYIINENGTEMIKQMSEISSNFLDLGYSLNYSRGIDKTTPNSIEKDSLVINNNTKQMIGMIKNGENMFMKQFQSRKNKSNVFEVRNENIYLSAQKVFTNKKRQLLHTPGITYEVLDLKPFNGTKIRVFLPISYLTQIYNNTIDSFGLNFYKNYPLINSNFKNNFSDITLSLNMFTEALEHVSVKNLTHPIGFLFTKSSPDLSSCVFIDEKTQKLSNASCTSININSLQILCLCNHLTTFSFTNYNPIKIMVDIENILVDAKIMNNFDNFKYLNSSNVYILYIINVLLFLYAGALLYAIRFDLKYEDCLFTMEVDRVNKCCSEEEVLEALEEVKDFSEKAVEKRKTKLMKEFFIDLSKKKQGANFFSALGINLHLSSAETNKNQQTQNQENNEEKEREESQNNNNMNSLNNHSDIMNFNKNTFSNKVFKIIKKKSTHKKNEKGEKLIPEPELKRNEASEELEKNKETEITNSITNVNDSIGEKENIEENDAKILSTVNISEDGIVISNKVVKFSEFAKSIIQKNENLSNKWRKNFTIKTKRRKAVNSVDIEMISKNLVEMNTENSLQSNNQPMVNDSIESNLESNESEEKRVKSSPEVNEETKKSQFSNGNPKNQDEILRIKNEWWVKVTSILTFFFKFEYKLVSFFIQEKGIFLKSDMATLFFVRIFLQLSLSAILSPENSLSGDEGTSSKGYKFSNRDMACAILTILLLEIPFTFFEILLAKNKVNIKWAKEIKEREKKKGIIIHIIVYIVLYSLSILGIINTIWVCITISLHEREKQFIQVFSMAIMMDLFVYSISLIFLKSSLFYFLTKSNDMPFWKKTIICILGMCPWVNIFFNLVH